MEGDEIMCSYIHHSLTLLLTMYVGMLKSSQFDKEVQKNPSHLKNIILLSNCLVRFWKVGLTKIFSKSPCSSLMSNCKTFENKSSIWFILKNLCFYKQNLNNLIYCGMIMC